MSRMNALGRVLGRGSAKHGADHWWAQRVTAVALVVLGAWFTVSLLLMPAINYTALRVWMSHAWNTGALVGLILVVAQHSYLGLRVVVEDYVHHSGKRIGTLLVLRFAHTLIAAAGVIGIFEVAFGGGA